MRKTSGLLLLVLGCSMLAYGQVPIVSENGATLEDLAGTDTLVTVVLKRSRARDANLKVVDFGDDYVAVITKNGRRTAYRFADIHEMRVQDGEVVRRQSGVTLRTLGVEDEDVVARAKARTVKIFSEGKAGHFQGLKAASISAASGDPDALAYLAAFAAVDDVAIAIDASLYLYIAGGDPSVKVVDKGVASGNLRIRANAARLLGIIGKTEKPDRVSAMLRDSVPGQFAAGAVAASGLENRAAIPTIISRGLEALNEHKGGAAVFALSALGGPEVDGPMREMLKASRGTERFRVVQVLAAAGDDQALELLRVEDLEEPAFATTAAIFLARRGQWDGLEFLRALFKKGRNPDRKNLNERAHAAAALFEGGHTRAKAQFQELLNMSVQDVYEPSRLGDKAYNEATVTATKVTVCNLIARLARPNLLSLLRPVIESPNPDVALAACEAALACSNAEYAKRLARAREFISVANPDYAKHKRASRFRFEVP